MGINAPHTLWGFPFGDREKVLQKLISTTFSFALTRQSTYGASQPPRQTDRYPCAHFRKELLGSEKLSGSMRPQSRQVARLGFEPRSNPKHNVFLRCHHPSAVEMNKLTKAFILFFFFGLFLRNNIVSQCRSPRLESRRTGYKVSLSWNCSLDPGQFSSFASQQSSTFSFLLGKSCPVK